MAYKLDNDGNIKHSIFYTHYYYYFKLCTRVILSAILFGLGITAFAMIAIAPQIAIGGLITAGIICSMVGASSLWSSLKEWWRNLKAPDLFKGCERGVRDGTNSPEDLSKFVRGAVFVDPYGELIHSGIIYDDDSIIASPGSSTGRLTPGSQASQ